MDTNQVSPTTMGGSTVIALQKEQLAIEREKVRVERQKGWLTAASIIISALGILAVYWNGQITQAREAEAAFELRLAEVVTSAGTASQAQSIIKALAGLFPERVSEAMQTELGNLQYGRSGKYNFLDLIATQSTPEGRCAVMKTYAELFPDDSYGSPKSIQNECRD